MARTPAQLKSAFWNVLYTDTAGTAVRAALGAGATSIVERQGLSAGVTNLPARPFIALQWGNGGGVRNRGIQTFFPVWWAYDEDLYGWGRLEDLVALIHAAYGEDSISMCYTDFLPVRELTDQALGGLPAKSLPFTIRTRG